jgi:hypothetical protein
MANSGSSSYTVLLSTKIDASNLQAQIDAKSKRSILLIKLQLDPTSQSKYESEMKKIEDKAKSIGKISISGDGAKAVVNYTDKLNQSVKATIDLKGKLDTVEAVTKNLAKDAREVAKAYEDAERFLGKAAKMNQADPKVKAGITIAEDLKKAAALADTNSIQRLSSELKVADSALSSVNQGVRSWTAGMAQSIKTTVQYATSIGLIYGALRQLKEGIKFVADLNKELTNIQVLQVDGAKTNKEIAELSLGYNKLATELGATTIEVARGSVEWLFN